MTEEEAKTKWCPFNRITPGNADYHACNNRGEVASRDATLSVNCIGSACTAWRWGRATSDAPSSIRHPGDTGAAADAYGFWYRDGKPIGFCGLAGRPA